MRWCYRPPPCPRQHGAVSVLRQLAAIVEIAVAARRSGPRARSKPGIPRSSGGLHPATLTFQALRIFVNDELNELERGLLDGARALRVGGRLAVIV